MCPEAELLLLLTVDLVVHELGVPGNRLFEVEAPRHRIDVHEVGLNELPEVDLPGSARMPGNPRVEVVIPDVVVMRVYEVIPP